MTSPGTLNPSPHSAGGWRRFLYGTRWILFSLAVLLIVVRIILPRLVILYVERQLEKSGEYHGIITDVDIALWRGFYRMQDVRIEKTGGQINSPFFSASAVDLSLEWKELLHGALVGEVAMSRPILNFVAGPTDNQSQSGAQVAWGEFLGSLFPFRLNRLEVREGEVHFQNEHSIPPVDIALNRLEVTATNLSNTRDISQELPASAIARASTIGGGSADLQIRLDPLAASPTFELTCELTNVNLVSLNDFLKAYGGFDVERGVFSLYTSVASREGNYEGYFKVLFENLDVFAWEKERSKNALEVFWQGVVGTLTTVFRNQPKDRLATIIPISGTYENPELGVWTAAFGLLQNAFIRAVLPKVDRQVTVEEVQRKKGDKRSQDPPRRATESPRGASQSTR